MANPSETYAVDSTLTFGTTEVNLTKDLSTLYPTLNSEIDNSISINALNDDLVKTVYRKSDRYNSLYDNSITFSASPVIGSSSVVKYYTRNGFPTDSVNITNAIAYGTNSEGRVYATGYSGDAGSVYNANYAGNLKFIRDLEYNKILFAITANEYSSIPVLAKGTIDYGSGQHNVPSVTGIDLKDIDPNKYYMSYDSTAAKIWNGSGWSNIDAHPIFVCNGETVQSIQSAGIAFYSEICQYEMVRDSGQNIELSISSTNHMNFGYNFCNVLDRSKYTLGWSDSYSTMPNWADIHEDIFTEINQHMIDNSQSSMSCTISREIINVSDSMSMLVSVVGQFYRNSSRIYSASFNCMMYPMIKGSALLKLLAGFGCYYRADSSLDVSELTPDTLHTSSSIWLGEMSGDGTTTGRWIKGSDIENYTGYNKDGNTNNPDFDPSGGSGGGGDDDDPWDGVDFGGTGAGGGGAFCSVYYMTGAQLTSLKNWSNTSAPEGFDMLPSIIGLQQLPVEVTGAPTTVKFLKSGAITSQGESRVVDTQVPAGTGTGQPISFSLGSIDINRRMQQRGEPYLDYDSTIELFLPFAGTFVLDTQAVMGRTISAEIVIDPVNGTAFAYAWVSQNGQKMPIAYGSSPIAVDLPIASNQWGISRAAFKQASHQMTMNAIKDIGNFIIGLGTFKTGQSGAIADRSGFASLSIQEGLQAKQIGSQMMTSSTINAATDTASAIVNTHQLNNTNYTAVNGSFGGSYAEWSQPFTAYVRITRPKFKKPSNFNHTQAVPCVDTKKLSDCTGLTICINPDCGAIPCTEAEKLMITQALVGGVYAGR